MKTFNINDNVKVKLTDKGKDIYYHQYDYLNKWYGKEMITPSYPKEDENGYSTFQLWYFMKLYGNYMNLGIIPVFSTELVIDEKDVREYEMP